MCVCINPSGLVAAALLFEVSVEMAIKRLPRRAGTPVLPEDPLHGLLKEMQMSTNYGKTCGTKNDGYLETLLDQVNLSGIKDMPKRVKEIRASIVNLLDNRECKRK